MCRRIRRQTDAIHGEASARSIRVAAS